MVQQAALGGPASSKDCFILLKNVEEHHGVVLRWYIFKNTLQNKLLLNTVIHFITLGTLPTSRVAVTVTFTVLENIVLVY